MEIPPRYRSKDLFDRYFESEKQALVWINNGASNSTWQYPQFRDYLVTQLEDDSEYHPTKTFPKRICLPQDWHDHITVIGRWTATRNLEMYDVVAGDVRTRRIALREPQFGYTEKVASSFLLEAQIQAAKEGYTHILGLIHSHPFTFLLKQNLIDRIFRIRHYRQVWFSEYDLLNIAKIDDTWGFIGVVGAKDILFAFKTKETDKFGVSDLASQGGSDEWVSHWRRGRGIRHSKELYEYLEKYTDLEQRINYGIAAKHRLVLYRGEPGKDLIREFPE